MALVQQDLGELVLAARSGDSAAHTALWVRCNAIARKIARRWAVSNADAEDISQDALLRAFSKLDAVRDPAALAGWLQVVIVRAVARVARREAAQRTVDTIPDLAARDASPDSLVELRRLMTLVWRLPEEQRACFWLRRAEGLDIAEIVRETALSPATVYRRMNVAERRIARLVRDKNP